MTRIPGYTYGTPSVAPSPLTLADLEELKGSVLFTDDDAKALQAAGTVLHDQVEEILDLWYGFVGSHRHLVSTFAGTDGKPIPSYLEAVRKRFGQWISDTCRRPMDQAWLDYQHEIGLRHSRKKKNLTDSVAASPVVPLRHLIALIVPITLTIRPFLARKGAPPEEVEAMYAAWFKAVTLQVALWARAYVPDEDY